MQAVFRPEPMPISRTRSPGSSSPACVARVNGIDAGPMLPRVGKVRGTRSGSMPTPVTERLGVDLGHLVHDVAVEVGPVEVGRGLLPQAAGELEAGVHQAAGVGAHPVEVADAELVVLGAGTADAADDPVPLGVLVGRAEHHRGGAGAEGQRRELGHHVARGHLGLDSRAIVSSCTVWASSPSTTTA